MYIIIIEIWSGNPSLRKRAQNDRTKISAEFQQTISRLTDVYLPIPTYASVQKASIIII